MNRLCFLAVSLMLSFIGIEVASAEPEKRPMLAIADHQVGLKVWIEASPEWLWEVKNISGQPVLVVDAPQAYYPPAVFSYLHSRRLSLGEEVEDLKSFALGAIQTAEKNLGGAQEITSANLEATSYNGLNGYEVEFSGVSQGRDIDVRMFVGRGEGGGPVSMQAITLKGKLPHLDKQILRAWNNVEYLH